jgi:steroid delta-isomerase-like uncharacterized protein
MDHLATMRRAYDMVNAHDFDGLRGLVADDFVEHEELPGGGAGGADGVAEFFRAQVAAFPDFTMTVQDLIDGGDKVVARVRVTGTHRGEFMGMPATGRPVDIELIDIMRFEDDGLVHEHWGISDQAAMMQQLGAGAP